MILCKSWHVSLLRIFGCYPTVLQHVLEARIIAKQLVLLHLQCLAFASPLGQFCCLISVANYM